jgi:DNA-binding transcriptional ArsR family regulator
MRKSPINALFPKTRQSVLSACLLHPDKWWYLSDLAGYLGVSPSSLQRELASLTAAGILESRKEGNRIYYKANAAAPVARELQSLLIKTVGIADVIKSVLKKHSDRIKLAFIYGSIASAREISTSDVDVMIVGDVSLAEMVSGLKKAEGTLAREINPTIFSQVEFARKAQEGDSFIKTVTKSEKIFIKGGPDELEALVG